jgi:hypothetical protein
MGRRIYTRQKTPTKEKIASVGNRATVRSRADSRTRDHMACAQARTIHVRAAALPSQSINHEPPTVATTVT